MDMTQKWQNAGAGPRQIKDLQSAIGKLTWEGRTHDELSGVVDGKEHRSTLMTMFGPVRSEAIALDEAIHAKYGNMVTKTNVREIIADYMAAVPKAKESRPTEDTRRTKAEDAAIQAQITEREAGYVAKRNAEDELRSQALSQAPPGAQALIVAEYHEDNSDTMTDYFSNQTKRAVAIGFRTGSREDFRQLRAAAARFPETAHMASQETLNAHRGTDDLQARASEDLEHRDNYSMGKGNYLSDHGWDGAGSGWVVKSYAFPAGWANLTEVAIPATGADLEGIKAEHPDWESPQERLDRLDPAGAVTVSPGHRDGYVEVRFPGKPAAEVRQGLKAHGFRWNSTDKCWYGRDAAYAESLAAGCCDECKA